MASPAQAHFERHMAQKAARQAGHIPGRAAPMPETGGVSAEYRMMMLALGEDLRQLRNIQSDQHKASAKRKMLPKYQPWLEGALSAETGAQDEVVAWMLIWALDLADWPLALRIGDHVLRHGLTPPELFKRTSACIIAEEVADAGLKPTPTADLATLQQVAALTEAEDMPDEVRAKLMKAMGLALKARFDAFDPEADHALAGGRPALAAASLQHLTAALDLDAKSGVKKTIEQLQRATKKLTEEPKP